VHMEFVKMHGLGNDFIILDDTDHRQKNGRESFETEKHCCEESELSPELVRHFCDRHRGIGADGVIRVCNAGHPQADFRMKLYNADGSPAKKKWEAAAAEGNRTEADGAYKVAVKKVDQAVAKGVLHKNTAAHRKSAMTLKLNKIG